MNLVLKKEVLFVSRPKSGRSKKLVLDYVPFKQDQDKNKKIAILIRNYLLMGYSKLEIAKIIGGNRGDIDFFLENY